MDYYCFPIKTGDISVFFNLEQYDNSRERFFYQTTQEDVILAKQKDKLLLFDLVLKNLLIMTVILLISMEKKFSQDVKFKTQILNKIK